MLKPERQAYILHQVNLHNQVLSANLSQQLDVSEDTIRRDLQELADNQKLIKVHGGALSLSFNDHGPATPIYAHTQKKLIARKAASLIQNDMFITTTGGTTLIELARTLPKDLKATFISGSLPVALEYCHHPLIDVILIGDKVSKNSRITVGGEAIARIRQIKADICFLGVNAIDIQHGITDNDWEVVQVKKAMIESAQKVICLTISEKIDSFQPFHVCPVEELDMLITELPPDDPMLEPYRQKGIEIF
ncbi:DeoR/GlpR family DNA-binding transcription regulator [Puia dinghuensis]|uniref:DeoR family transcriptional regulator n=1 Tax=Puia dinghuensis TaxID=1792502 RepID=A0A8J2XSN1_9BACT|nr:DeoR/GlpR family DNA-binding transcription regulator [Puia dinghuensis]GGA96452.1 DeoR family transcriptional regulator [Puia dinghuensis]